MTEKTSLNQYFSSIDGGNLLTKKEEIELAKIMDNGRWHDKDGSISPDKLWDLSKDPKVLKRAKKAREKLVNSNLRLVASIAKYYQNKGCELEDLIQEGNIGLMDGIDRFDYKKNLKISTYCTWWIKQRIDRLISNHGRTVRVPVHVQTLANKLKSIMFSKPESIGEMPSTEEIAEKLGCTTDMAKQAWQAVFPNHTIAIDHTPHSMGEEKESLHSESLHSYIEDSEATSPLESIEEQELVTTIKEAIKILRLRFGIVEDPKDHESWPITVSEIKELKNRLKNKVDE